MDASTGRRSLVVKVTVGEDARERCSEGFTVAAAAASAGADVSLWLSGEAVWLATPGRAAGFDLAHAAPLDGILDLMLGSRHGHGLPPVRDASRPRCSRTSSPASSWRGRRRTSNRSSSRTPRWSSTDAARSEERLAVGARATLEGWSWRRVCASAATG